MCGEVVAVEGPGARGRWKRATAVSVVLGVALLAAGGYSAWVSSGSVESGSFSAGSAGDQGGGQVNLLLDGDYRHIAPLSLLGLTATGLTPGGTKAEQTVRLSAAGKTKDVDAAEEFTSIMLTANYRPGKGPENGNTAQALAEKLQINIKSLDTKFTNVFRGSLAELVRHGARSQLTVPKSHTDSVMVRMEAELPSDVDFNTVKSAQISSIDFKFIGMTNSD